MNRSHIGIFFICLIFTSFVLEVTCGVIIKMDKMLAVALMMHAIGKHFGHGKGFGGGHGGGGGGHEGGGTKKVFIPIPIPIGKHHGEKVKYIPVPVYKNGHGGGDGGKKGGEDFGGYGGDDFGWHR